MPFERKVADHRRSAAVRRYSAGESSRALAKVFGVTPPTIITWVRDVGAEVRPVGRPKVRKTRN